ncbi:hypothetical protein [Actinomadura sp. BRA 177]|uniref:hypothetical protein n=1 Tax=Actinomadura sp. BRA 177 TaxID=2745202 RepID=UPI0015958804|nr:hypothetical protein [Actinomadura sp. BRA 177]NVI86119.1 hypothetical protein [Actinomadura sp. BRA 177]
MIQITLGEKTQLDSQEDPLGRAYLGFTEEMTDEQLYEANHGRWILGPRADNERFAIFNAKGVIRQAIEIERIVPSGDRRAIEGKILAAGHPVYDAYVGKPAPAGPFRNPIAYFESEHDARVCGCGCGAVVAPGHFLPGHDQKALYDRVAKIGTVHDFILWFDQFYEPQAAESDTEI